MVIFFKCFSASALALQIFCIISLQFRKTYLYFELKLYKCYQLGVSLNDPLLLPEVKGQEKSYPKLGSNVSANGNQEN